MMKISILRCLKVNKSFFRLSFIPLLQYLECKTNNARISIIANTLRFLSDSLCFLPIFLILFQR